MKIISIRILILKFFIIICLVSNCNAEDNQVSHTTWLSHDWLENYDSSKIEKLAKILVDLKIKTIYPALSQGKKCKIDGLNKYGWVKNPSTGKHFVARIKELVPGIKIIPYKGLTGCPRWDENSWLSLANAFYWSMIVLNADGIQFDYECGNFKKATNLNIFKQFFKRLKIQLGSKTLSVAMPIITEQKKHYVDYNNLITAPWFVELTSSTKPRYNGTLPHIYQTIFAHADQVVIMIYDTWFTELQIAHYQKLVTNQIWVGAWFSKQYKNEFIPGIRFSVTNSPKKGMHFHTVENPVTTRTSIKHVITKPIDSNTYVKDYLKSIAWFRADVLFEDHNEKAKKILYHYRGEIKSITKILEAK